MSTFLPPTDYFDTDGVIEQYHFTNTVYLLWLTNHHQCRRELPHLATIHDEERIEIVRRCLQRMCAQRLRGIYLDWPARWEMTRRKYGGIEKRGGGGSGDEETRDCCFQHQYPELWNMEYNEHEEEA